MSAVIIISNSTLQGLVKVLLMGFRDVISSKEFEGDGMYILLLKYSSPNLQSSSVFVGYENAAPYFQFNQK
jgi:hypothetical protein